MLQTSIDLSELNYGDNPSRLSSKTSFKLLTVTGTPMDVKSGSQSVVHWRINLVREKNRDPGFSVIFDTSKAPKSRPYPIALV